MIAVREFTNASDMMAHYKAVNARLQVQPKFVRTAGDSAFRDGPEDARPEDTWYRGELATFTPEDRAKAIKLRIADRHGIAVEDLAGSGKDAQTIGLRFMAIRQVREANPEWSLYKIGQYFNKPASAIANALSRTAAKMVVPQ